MMAVGCLIVGFLLFPLYWMTNVSLQPREALLANEPRWLPDPAARRELSLGVSASRPGTS